MAAPLYTKRPELAHPVTDSPLTVESLRNRVFKAGAWALGGDVLGQLIRLGSNLILTRLLMPELFGLMAIVTTVIMGLGLFSDLGLYVNIVQSQRGDDPRFLNAIWSIHIARGVLIWLLALLVCAYLVLGGQFHWLPEGTTYAEPELPLVIAITAFGAVIAGFQSTKLATAVRHLAQHHLVRLELYSQLSGLAVMILWALLDRSVWALVAGSLVTTSFKTMGSHRLLPGEANRWQWSWPVFWEVLNFGQWIFLSSILSFLFSNGDRLLLGGLVSPTELGIYSIAMLMVTALQALFMKINGSVAFPALSEVYRQESDQLKQTYYKFRRRLDLAIVLVAGFLMLFGHWLIDLLYDDRYLAAGPLLQLLSLLLLAQIYSLADQCFLTLGKPKLLSLLNAVRAAALFLLMPLGFSLGGLHGAVWGVVLSYFAGVPVSMLIKSRHEILDLRRELLVLPVWIGMIFWAVLRGW